MSGSVSSKDPRPGHWSLALAGLLVLAPLPLGGNRPVAWAAFAVAAGGIVCWWAVTAPRHALPKWLPWVAALYLTAPAWALAQASGWGAAWHHPLWRAAGLPGAIALTPALAVDGAVRLLTYGAVFVLALDLGRDAVAARRLLRLLGGAAAAIATYGLAVHLGGFETILWWDKWTYRGVLTATFVNRNAAALFFGFGTLVCLTLLLRDRRRGRKMATVATGAALLLCGLALLLTESRAGVGAAAVAVVVQLAAVAAARSVSWRAWGRGTAMAAVAGALLFAVAGQGVVARLIGTAWDRIDRVPVHAAVLEAIAARPWLGYGLGGFDGAFMAWRPRTLDQHWDYAHSTWLESAFELGLPAAGALFAGLGVLGAVCVGGLMRRRRRMEYPALGLAALTLCGLQALVDFGVQMPANALWLAAVLGVACAQSSPTRAASTARASGRSDKARR